MDNIVLEGTSNFISAIWAEATAGLNNGKVYVASTGTGAALSIIDLNTKTLYDRYTKDLKGRSNDKLIQEDIEDISA